MLSMSRRANGARWFASNSLKFRVGGVFVNGKMTVSLSSLAHPVQVKTRGVHARAADDTPESAEY